MRGLFSEQDEKIEFYADKAINTGCAMHFQSNLEMLYLLRGNHTAVVNGKKYHGTKDDVFFVNQYDIHMFDSEDGGENVLLIFSLSSFKDAARAFEGLRLPNLLDDKEVNVKILPYAERLVNGEGLTFLQKASIIDAIADILIGRYAHPIGEQIKSDDTIYEILKYINENFDKPFDRDEVAKIFGYNPTYLSTLFKQKAGMGLSEYVKLVRYSKVQESINRKDVTKKNILDVVLECGFDSVSSYYRYSKKAKEIIKKE